MYRHMLVAIAIVVGVLGPPVLVWRDVGFVDVQVLDRFLVVYGFAALLVGTLSIILAVAAIAGRLRQDPDADGFMSPRDAARVVVRDVHTAIRDLDSFVSAVYRAHVRSTASRSADIIRIPVPYAGPVDEIDSRHWLEIVADANPGLARRVGEFLERSRNLSEIFLHQHVESLEAGAAISLAVLGCDAAIAGLKLSRELAALAQADEGFSGGDRITRQIGIAADLKLAARDLADAYPASVRLRRDGAETE